MENVSLLSIVDHPLNMFNQNIINLIHQILVINLHHTLFPVVHRNEQEMSSRQFTLNDLLRWKVIQKKEEKIAERYVSDNLTAKIKENSFYFPLFPYLSSEQTCLLLHQFFHVINLSSFRIYPRDYIHIMEMDQNPYLDIFPDNYIIILLRHILPKVPSISND